MLDASISDQIADIAGDRTSGAAELGVRAARILQSVKAGQLAEAAEAIRSAQPAMATVFNAAEAARRGDLDAFLERIQRAPGILSGKAAALCAGRTVLTHSYSSTVIGALVSGAPAAVICTESLPGGEGKRAAELLNARLIPDTAVFTALPKVDLVLVGADAVLPDAIVNKVGTAAIALAARLHGKPVFVLCGRDKFVPAEWQPDLGHLFEKIPRAWFAAIIDDEE